VAEIQGGRLQPARDPSPIEQIRAAHVHRFLNRFGGCRFRINVLVVDELGIASQIGAAGDGGPQIVRIAGDELAAFIQRHHAFQARTDMRHWAHPLLKRGVNGGKTSRTGHLADGRRYEE